ncbi:MAG: 30S ribosomal protein S6 [Patescibacteria group bacterium]
MDKESDPKLYELSFLAKAADEPTALECAASVNAAIEKERGIIASQNQPIRKILSYPVKKETEAWFGWIKFMAKPEAVAGIEKTLKDCKPVIRLTVVQTGKDGFMERPRRRRRLIRPATPQKETNIEEIDKKLEEMLGK